MTLRQTLAAAALAAAALLPASAAATTISFHQAGFDDGATLAGSFTGHDGDGDGWIHAYELTAFSLVFSGNRAVGAFAHGMEERAGLVFRVADQAILHLATFAVDDDQISRTFEYDAFGWPTYDIPGRVQDHRSGGVSITDQPLVVTPAAVPQPPTPLLAAAALGAIGWLGHRRRRTGPAPR